ncbi:MAG: nucleotidyl transferase AbiEii/AbiGii toxin family protein [Phycisphaerae bacterium]|nr:nucleotidyl transferase AbiEii/AbiGii toxin family protein [Phycisphaerae bacterium]
MYYAMERLLYRLSRSPHAGRFILKGALLLTAWRGSDFRATQDIDLLGRMNNDLDAVIAAFRDVCRQDVQLDGLAFDADRIRAERITEEADYHGVRVYLHARLRNARIDLHVDIGFADPIVPGPVELDYPVLLDLPAPRLRGYSRPSIVAEKLHAMVRLGRLNSRMKDFHDLWFLARNFPFDGATLAQAVAATFAQRHAPVPAQPLALTPHFANQPDKQTQWAAFLKRLESAHHSARPSGLPDELPDELPQLIAHLAEFLTPATQALADNQPFNHTWNPPGPWKP